MFAPKEYIYHLSLLLLIGKSQKRVMTQSIFKIYRGHLHLEHNLCAKYRDPSSSGSPDKILFTMSLIATMPKSEKGHNSVRYSQIFTKS